MPKPTSKSRQELRSRFVRNAIPTETDFADLIAASLNQADDGVLKLPDQPLGLVRQKPDQPVLRFFADPAAEGSVWQLQLGAGDKPGFGLAGADGKLALFVDGATGNVGIGTDSSVAKLQINHANQDPNGGTLILGPTSQSNLRLGYNQGYSWIQSHGNMPLAINSIGNSVGIGTTTPGFKLDVNGTVRLGGFTLEEKDEWPNIIWCRDLATNWDEGLIKHGKSNGFFGRAGFGIHTHESRSFEVFSTGWRPLFGIEGGSGNTSIRGQTSIMTGFNPIRFSSKWTGFPDDKTNGAEICNDTENYKTLMLVGNKSNGGNRRVSVWDVLEVNGTLRVQNPGDLGKDGKMALFVDGVTGKVGMGTATPGSTLNILEQAGTAAGPNTGTLLLDHEDAGGASSIVFRSKVNRGSDHGFIEYRDKNPGINDIEAALLTIGNQNDANDHIALMPSGNVGIGTTTPGFKLDVNGTVKLGGFTSEEKEEWPNIVWCRDLDKGWDEGLIKHGKNFGFFGRAGFGIHIHESRSFELFSTGWRPLLGIEGGSGNTSIRGQTNILTGTNPIRFSSAWTGFPDDKTNGAEISNDTSGHKTLMIIGNKSNGGGRRVSVWDILEVNGTCMANGSFQVNGNGNTFKIDTLADRAIFTLAKAAHGTGRQISWDGDNNWDQWSDETLKTNINIETGILPRLLQIDVKSFQWKDDLESKKRQLGFIAQDVRLAFPDLVKEKPFGDQSLMSLNYTNFGILAVGAIKELNAIMAAEIQELRVELDRLKQQVGD